MVLSGLRGGRGLAGAALCRVVEEKAGPPQERDGAVRPGLGLLYDCNTVLLTTATLTAALTGPGEAPEADGGVAGGGPWPGSSCLT